MQTFNDDQLRSMLEKDTGAKSLVPGNFHSFTNCAEDVKKQARMIRSHPWVPKEINLTGYVFDVNTGDLNQVDLGGGLTSFFSLLSLRLFHNSHFERKKYVQFVI